MSKLTIRGEIKDRQPFHTNKSLAFRGTIHPVPRNSRLMASLLNWLVFQIRRHRQVAIRRSHSDTGLIQELVRLEGPCKIFPFSPWTVLAQCSVLYLVISRDTENTQVYNTFPPLTMKHWSTGRKLLNTTVTNTYMHTHNRVIIMYHFNCLTRAFIHSLARCAATLLGLVLGSASCTCCGSSST